jgi:tRNA-dihydrouridine synthase B
VQIAGGTPQMMAEAARYNIDRGAQIIDINMGCPAKKVCNAWAGSALMQDEPLALDIIAAVVPPARRATCRSR